MKLRKKFNLLTNNQRLKVYDEFSLVYGKATKLAYDENRKRKEICDVKKKTCPSCNLTNVVEKIIGYKHEGYGMGSTLKKCRHCSDCGNDWIIEEPEIVYTSDILCRWFFQLRNLIDTNKSKNEIINECNYFNDIHAESVMSLYEIIFFCSDKPKKISLKKLRDIYKSVFDDN